MSNSEKENIKNKIFDLARDFYLASNPEKSFQPGIDYIPVSGKVIDVSELL